MTFDEYIEATNKAASVDALFEIFKKAMADLGFDRLIFSLMTDHPCIGRPAGHGIILNYPGEWMKFYAEKNYEVTDPVRHKMYLAESAFAWEDLSKYRVLSKGQSECLALGNEAGLHSGIGIPLHGPRGAVAGIGAASSAGGVELNKNTLSHAQLFAQQFYTVFLELQKPPQDIPAVFLSDREQEVLKWCAIGKTKAEIGDIMNLSEHTIEFHVRKAQQKLDANSTTLAVFKALHLGLIQF
jgi:DNA-binding CsgD family transcriptional regulator